MLERIERFGIERRFTGIQKVISDLKLSVAGPQGKDESITIFFALRTRSRLHRLTTRGHRHSLINLRAFGQVELEIVIIHLGARRAGLVIHRE